MTPPRDQDDAEAEKKPAQAVATQSFEGDYRPSSEAPPVPGSVKVDPLQTEFLMRLANALNTTLDLQTLMHRTADLVRAVIDYKIFAILLLNERTNDLRMRFQIGHSPEVERLKIRVGQGVVGRAAEHREPILVQDVQQEENYISANPDVRSELAVPLIVKNRVIGVIDLQSEQVGYFQPEHLRLLELTASRVAQAIENARLYTRVARQAQTLAVLNEIAREVTSILDLDPAAGAYRRAPAAAHRLPDVQHSAPERAGAGAGDPVCRALWPPGPPRRRFRWIAAWSGPRCASAG